MAWDLFGPKKDSKKKEPSEGKKAPTVGGTINAITKRHQQMCAAQGLTWNPKTKSCE